MKKTIAALALFASASTVSAMPGPRNPNAPQPTLKHYCLETHKVGSDRSAALITCDESPNNVSAGKDLKENGCAKGQIALRTYEEIAISACMPPGVAQL